MRVSQLVSGEPLPEGLVGSRSSTMREVYRQVQEVSSATFPILVLGETGVGKEHVVRMLHDGSPRSGGPFVAVNCAAIPGELLEAEMFGVARGAATGVVQRPGRFQLAAKGTLFLDEIGDMPTVLQAKLLRVLQDQEVRPLGGAAQRTDVRVIAATNAELGSRVTAGSFRPDLYYRLAAFEIVVPPLRERPEDIGPLADHFLDRLARIDGRRTGGLTAGALSALRGYPWPGNVRELEREMRRAAWGCCDGQPITATMLSPHLRARRPPAETGLLRRRVAELEAQLIGEALAATADCRARAARLLGISRNGLAIKMRRLGV